MMNTIYRQFELLFERLTAFATVILSNSITFILALIMVMYWLSDRHFLEQDLHTSIGEVILSITFLSMFIIQKSFSRFSGALLLKVNELVASHEPANNAVLNAEERTEAEIVELSKGYSALTELERKIEPNQEALKRELE
ncbi:MAG: low affinity iron permease family protein [Bacteroidetes bacterium]|nr:low affinity iron permease family protein [Bacteroidota bacterium]